VALAILDFRFWILDLLPRLELLFFAKNVFANESTQRATFKFIYKTNPKSKIQNDERENSFLRNNLREKLF